MIYCNLGPFSHHSSVTYWLKIANFHPFHFMLSMEVTTFKFLTNVQNSVNVTLWRSFTDSETRVFRELTVKIW